MNQTDLTLYKLATVIVSLDEKLAGFAIKAVNASLTLRNWAIGFFIK